MKYSRDQDGDGPIEIAGAGPAGLAAAITLANAGREVIVHEAMLEVGHRFNGDLQGLENWSAEQDILQWMQELGLTTKFSAAACRRGVAFDAWGERYDIGGDETLFYMIERGPGPSSLDSALKAQALALGVDIRFGSRVRNLEGSGILATGPRAADVIAVGYHFKTSMENGFWVILDDSLAPGGYAYVLVMNGRGTIKSCMFTDFKQESMYVDRAVQAFRKLIDLEMIEPIPHGGVGNFHVPKQGVSGGHPIAGEQAGFQDFLWGFGIRFALHSGVVAAECLLGSKDYDQLWRESWQSTFNNSLVNRACFSLLGNRGYRWILQHQHARNSNARRSLYKLYQPSLIRRLLLPWAKQRFHSNRLDEGCLHQDCTCVWCRHGIV